VELGRGTLKAAVASGRLEGAERGHGRQDGALG